MRDSRFLSTLTNTPRFLSWFQRNFSKTLNNRKQQWNSKTNVIITHPLLVKLESCTSMAQLKQIQALMTRTSLITDTCPVSRVLAFCAVAENGDFNHARVLFSQIVIRNTYMWNLMIRGCCRVHLYYLGFWFLGEMVKMRVDLDSRSFVFGLKVCGMLTEFAGKLIHCLIWKMGFENCLLVQNGLIHFYSVCGCLGFARKAFDEMSVKDVFSWTSIIGGYTVNDSGSEALKLFDLMLCSDVEPNEVTVIAVLSLCSREKDLRLGKRLHEYVKERNLNCSLNLMNAFLDMYVKCDCLVSARKIFNELENKDVFSWTTMVNGYTRVGELVVARKLFDNMPKKNEVSWNTMIAGYSKNHRPREALGLFREMLNAGLEPTENTLVCVLSACGQLGSLHLGQWIHSQYVNRIQVNTSVIVANSLIDMYAKCGVIDEAEKVFNRMSKRDLVSWNSMIAAYASHGQPKQAIIVFKKMQALGFKPDDVTLVGVLSACSHGGVVKEGREFFLTMENKHGIKPKGEHYACIIDLLGRVGLLDEANDIIIQMPIEPNKASWGSLLNACRMHGNVKLAKLAAHKLLDLDPQDSGVYVQLATVCANARLWDDARTIRSLMRKTAVKKTPGHSLIDIDGVFHEFLAADNSHPESEGIHRVLDELLTLYRMGGHKKDSELANPFQFWDQHG